MDDMIEKEASRLEQARKEKSAAKVWKILGLIIERAFAKTVGIDVLEP